METTGVPPEEAPAPATGAPPEDSPAPAPAPRVTRSRTRWVTQSTKVVSSFKARNWKDVDRHTISVLAPQDDQPCVSCGGSSDGRRRKEINLLEAVQPPFKSLAYVKQILEESSEEEATLLDENGRTPDYYVSEAFLGKGKQSDDDRAMHRILSQACAVTIRRYAEEAEWSKLVETLPSLARSREQSQRDEQQSQRDTTKPEGLSDLLRNDAALGPHGWTALHLAARNGQVLALEKLVALKADASQQCLMLGYTALHHAVANGASSCVKTILEKRSEGALYCENDILEIREHLEKMRPLELAKDCLKNADPRDKEKFKQYKQTVDAFDAVELGSPVGRPVPLPVG